jgi:pimeloyl-ACP methyl ester carboxylesterase
MSLIRAKLGAVELDYEAVGGGSPVLLIHGGVFADWFEPLMAEPALESFRRVRYRRVGYGGGGPIAAPLGIVDQAAHARALLEHLGIERAHVVGHSSGGSIALQLARDAPHRVRSLALLEPVLMQLPLGPAVAEALQRYTSGDPRGAVDEFLRGVCGRDYAARLERALPRALAEARRVAPTFFGRELPALKEWAFTAEDAARIALPILAVLGGNSDAVRCGSEGGSTVFADRQRLLLTWFPHATAHVLPNVTHLMLLEDPGSIARRLAEFFVRVEGS